MTTHGARVRAAHDAVAAMARLAGVSPEAVLSYFAFHGRLNLHVQSRISDAEVAVLGLNRVTRKGNKRRDIMHLADFHFENECGINEPFTVGRAA